MTIEQAYEKMGADYNGVLTRFMSEALVTRFAGKFLTDPSFDALKNALAAKDVASAFCAAHTLKGICQNLAIANLAQPLCTMTELLRAERLEEARALLPEVRPSSGFFANSEPELFGRAIPICAAAGDQHAALFGQTCFAPGEVKNTYGTGAFMLMQTGARPVDSTNGLLTTIAWGEGSQVDYALEGSVFIAGAVVQWLRDELGLISSASESESWARKASDSAGVYVVPAFTGLGAPYWDSNARGTITGLTRGARREHIIRAALESIAYQTQDVLALMRREAGVEIPALRVDGGASANNFLMQFQADISDIPVLRPASVETTAQGAAFLAGLACGVYSGREEIAALYRAPRRFMPHMDTQARITLLAGWQRAVRASRSDGL